MLIIMITKLFNLYTYFRNSVQFKKSLDLKVFYHSIMYLLPTHMDFVYNILKALSIDICVTFELYQQQKKTNE